MTTESTLHIVCPQVCMGKVRGKTSGVSAQTVLSTSTRRWPHTAMWSTACMNKDEKPKPPVKATTIAKHASSSYYQVGQIKWGQCSFFLVVKHVLENFDIFGRWNLTVHLRTLSSIKIKYFLPEGTKINDFLCSSILVVLLITFTLNHFINFINK